MKIQFNIMLFPALILLVAAVGLAQIDERKQAIALFQQGKDAEAAAKFKRLLKQSNAANDAEQMEGDILSQKETLELVRAYYRLGERPRKRLLELAKALEGDNTSTGAA